MKSAPFALAWLCALLLLASFVPASSVSAPGQEPPDSAAYLIVVDHSGSMKGEKWTEMKERAFSFMDRISLESKVVLWVFSDSGTKANSKRMTYTIQSDADRDKVKKHIQDKGTPKGGTAIYDTLWYAFEEAERLSAASPERYISVMLYTDGKDEHSKRSSQELCDRFNLVVAKNRNLWMFITLIDTLVKPFPEDCSDHIRTDTEPKIPVSLFLAPTAFTLPSPSRTPSTSLDLKLKGFENSPALLKGKSAELRFVPAPGSSLEARLTPSSIPLDAPSVTVRVDVLDPEGLKADSEYAGSIVVTYPELPEHVIQGTQSIDLSFQKEEPPKISGLRPLEGSIFATGKDIVFLLTTLKGAQVLWDFGDDNSERGTRAVHAYTDPGEKEVVVTVTGPSGLRSVRKIHIELVSAFVTVDQPSGAIYAGVATDLHASERGGVTHFQWMVDGRELLGTGERGENLTVTFQEPGKVPVTVRGMHPKLNVESVELLIDVRPLPSVVIEEPISGSTKVLGTEVPFRAKIKGPATSVTWIVTDADNGSIVDSEDVPVVEGKAQLIHVFPEGKTPANLRITAEMTIQGMPAPVRDSREIRTKAPMRDLAIQKPDRGQVLGFGKSVTFEAKLSGPGATHAMWTLVNSSDGSVLLEKAHTSLGPEGLASIQHKFDSPRDFPLQVIVRASDGSAVALGFPEARADFRVEHPPIEAKITIQSQGDFSTPVSLLLTTKVAPDQVTWDFGDGSKDDSGNLAPTHVYDAHGSFTVQATVVGAGGKSARPSVVVDISLTSPVASLGMYVDGKPTSSVDTGESVTFADESSGDVASRSWIVDGQVEDDKGPRLTLHFDDEGTHHVQLRVVGPHAADGTPGLVSSAEADLPVVHLDHVLFILCALGVGLLAGFVMFLFSRNQPRAWRVGLSQRLDDSPITRRVALHWSYFRKEARVPVNKLLKTEYWNAATRKNESFIVQRGSKDSSGFRPRVGFTESGTNPAAAVMLESDPIRNTATKHFWLLSDQREGAVSPLYLELEMLIAKGGRDLLIRLLSLLAAGSALYALSNYVYGSLW